MGKVKSKKLPELMAIVLCMLSVVCCGKVAQAQEKTFSVTGSNLTIVNNVVTAFTGDKEQTKEVVIPVGVTAIGDGVFRECGKLETIVMPDTVTSFGKNTFTDCGVSTMAVYSAYAEDGTVKIEDFKQGVIVLPKSLNTIDVTTFSMAKSIRNFFIPEENTVFKTASANAEQTEMGELLLSKDGTKLYRMAPSYGVNDIYYLPEGIVEILAYSLESNMGGNRSFVIPASVVSIGDYAFYGCGNLNGIQFAEEGKLTTIGAFTFAKNSNISNNSGWFKLPKSVTTIGESCFKDCVNMQIDLSETNIESIPQYIFDGCQNIHSVTMPKSLKYLEAYAFYGCTNLNNIYFLGETLDKIGTGAFKGCNNLHEIEVPEGVKSIENDTFDGCQNLNKIILPDSLENIGDNAFKDCQNIHEMVIPKNVTYISNSSFTGAKQDEIDTSKNEYAQSKLGGLPKKGKTFIVENVKYKVTKSAKKNGTVAVVGVKSKKLTKAVVKDTVQMGGYTFKVTAINKNAFKKCTKLKNVTIGKNVTKIDSNAFYGDKKLSKITIKSTKLKSVGKNALKGVKKNATIKVPKSKLKKYKKLFKSKTGYKKTMKIKK
ncbi:MAG: leucine-rich repeat domain-containing protein [Lachnospiraceae bacterium]|nr:leucine-rich repeat domain-containing protein [Lachnospiraceae bacterium]